MKYCDVCDDDAAYTQVVQLISPEGESDPERIVSYEFCGTCLTEYIARLNVSARAIVANMAKCRNEVTRERDVQ